MSDAGPIDARGLKCPWPALRFARAVREAAAGSTVSMIADDPAAERELAALAKERGWTLRSAPDQGGVRFETTA